MKAYNQETNRAWTTQELFAMLHENGYDEIDAFYIPDEVDELTENIDDDLIGEVASDFGNDIAGIFEIHSHPGQDDKIINMTVKGILKYASQNNDSTFAVSAHDIRRFLGILTLTGYDTLPQLYSYCSKSDDKSVDQNNTQGLVQPDSELKKKPREAYDSAYYPKSSLLAVKWHNNSTVIVANNYAKIEPLHNAKRFSRSERR
ncbi:hypothetical protein HHI36_000689 [Cryptolaemus montrouzieri]|uniref:Uncharacterized protein n=1 Tax=Cryptolaemus montrouzieri TaxID=559131 RepID=A0ABD2P5D8_9CUCU